MSDNQIGEDPESFGDKVNRINAERMAARAATTRRTPKHNPALELIEKMDASRARQIEAMSQTEHGRKRLARHGIDPVEQEIAQPASSNSGEAPSSSEEGPKAMQTETDGAKLPPFGSDPYDNVLNLDKRDFLHQAGFASNLTEWGASKFADIAISRGSAMLEGRKKVEWAQDQIAKIAAEFDQRGYAASAAALHRYADPDRLGEPLFIQPTEVRKQQGVQMGLEKIKQSVQSEVGQANVLSHLIGGGAITPDLSARRIGPLEVFSNNQDAFFSLGMTDLDVQVLPAQTSTREADGSLTIEVPLEIKVLDRYDFDSGSPFFMVRDVLEEAKLAKPFPLVSKWRETLSIRAKPLLGPDGAVSGYDIQNLSWKEPFDARSLRDMSPEDINKAAGQFDQNPQK